MSKIDDRTVSIPLLPGWVWNEGVIGLNIFKDSLLHYGKIFIYIPSGISGNSILMTDNVARGITPTSNRTITNAGYATDDDISTYASVTASAVGDYIMIDLGAVYSGWHECKVYTADASLKAVVEVSSDGTTWNTIISEFGGTTQYYSGALTFRYWRMRCTAVVNPFSMWVYECQHFRNYKQYSSYPVRDSITPLSYAKKTVGLRLPSASPFILATEGRDIR
jgi:hypothetical protein